MRARESSGERAPWNRASRQYRLDSCVTSIGTLDTTIQSRWKHAAHPKRGTLRRQLLNGRKSRRRITAAGRNADADAHAVPRRDGRSIAAVRLRAVEGPE